LKAILYARFSPRPDAAESESNAAQLDLCRAYAKRMGWAVMAEHQDAALSGDDEDRPGLWAALDALSRKGVLLVYKLDRLARSVYLSHIIEQEARKKRSRIVSVVGEGTWSNTPEDELIRRILQALAEYQKKAQAARTRAAMLRHQASGRRMSAQSPLGWRPDPTNSARLIEDEDERQTLGLVRKLHAEGLGLRQIARALNERGCRCRGRAWHHQAVKRILGRAGN
jgi:DNA invertase Pin-like site-specific DNA recombinase